MACSRIEEPQSEDIQLSQPLIHSVEDEVVVELHPMDDSNNPPEGGGLVTRRMACSRIEEPQSEDIQLPQSLIHSVEDEIVVDLHPMDDSNNPLEGGGLVTKRMACSRIEEPQSEDIQLSQSLIHSVEDEVVVELHPMDDSNNPPEGGGLVTRRMACSRIEEPQSEDTQLSQSLIHSVEDEVVVELHQMDDSNNPPEGGGLVTRRMAYSRIEEPLSEDIQLSQPLIHSVEDEVVVELHPMDDSNNPLEERMLFFKDGTHSIDYVLVWRTKEKDVKVAEERDVKAAEKRAATRKVFEKNLRDAGLLLEDDYQKGRYEQYTKVHAPWKVLARHAELMKLRMPIKPLPEWAAKGSSDAADNADGRRSRRNSARVPSEIKPNNWVDALVRCRTRLMAPFQVDPNKVPPIPNKDTLIYEDGKDFLFDIPTPHKELFFSHATRSMIVDCILRKTHYSTEAASSFGFGIKSLLNKKIYYAAYPLHEGSWKLTSKPSMRRLLYENWAHWRNFYKYQPLDHVRIYFGETVAMYFCWLGYYTFFLITASIVGVIVFIYGLVTIQDDVVSKESCDRNNNFTMCPKCERSCPYWNYADVCNYVHANHLFDNGATIFFAVFMSFWGTFFIEFWKRQEKALQFKWNLLNFQEEEQPPRPEYMAQLATCKTSKTHPVSGMEEPYREFWKQRVPRYIGSFTVMLLLCLLAVGVVISIVVYRMATLAALYLQDEEIYHKNAAMVTARTAGIINLLVMYTIDLTYHFVAVKLTDLERLRTQTAYDNSLTFKLYLLQFVNFYSSLFYIAFFKGKFAGGPNQYKRLFGARQEECQGGCLMELCEQLAIIFIGKQLLNALKENVVPRVKKAYKAYKVSWNSRPPHTLTACEYDYVLSELNPQGMFSEYLAMLQQFGFVTIFVAAFPLAPLIALINNVIEIRTDANKFVTQLRRPMALRTQTIGIWCDVLYGVSRLAILSNACIIAVTSTFIDRLVYELKYSDDGSLHGYVNSSLAYFNVSDFHPDSRFIDKEGRFENLTYCRYADYRAPPWAVTPQRKYKYTVQFWHIMAAKIVFIAVFENVIIVVTGLIAYLIPDMPGRVQKEARRETRRIKHIVWNADIQMAVDVGRVREHVMERVYRAFSLIVNGEAIRQLQQTAETLIKSP